MPMPHTLVGKGAACGRDIIMNVKKTNFPYIKRKMAYKRVVAAILSAALGLGLCADSGMVTLAADDDAASYAVTAESTQNTIGGGVTQAGDAADDEGSVDLAADGQSDGDAADAVAAQTDVGTATDASGDDAATADGQSVGDGGEASGAADDQTSAAGDTSGTTGASSTASGEAAATSDASAGETAANEADEAAAATSDTATGDAGSGTADATGSAGAAATEDGSLSEASADAEADTQATGTANDTGTGDDTADAAGEQTAAVAPSRNYTYVDDASDLDTGFDKAYAAMSRTKGHPFLDKLFALASTGSAVDYDWTYEIYYVGQSDDYYVEESSDFSLKYQMEFDTSVDLEAGAVKIMIPVEFYEYRDGTYASVSDIAVPYGEPGDYTASTVTVMNYYYETIDGVEYLVFWNYDAIESGTSIAWQVLYKSFSVMKTVDMTEWSLESTASVDVEIDGQTVTQTVDGEPLTGLVDTEAHLNSVTKSAYAANTGQTYSSSLYTQSQVNSMVSWWTDAGENIYNNDFDDYIYLVWKVTVTGSGTQPYDLYISEDAGDGGIVVGYSKYSGTFDYSISDDTADDEGYYQVADCVSSSDWSTIFRVVVAYPRSLLDEEASDGTEVKHSEYYDIGPVTVSNDIEVKLTPEDEQDDSEYKSASATAEYGERIKVNISKHATTTDKSYGPGLYTVKQVEKYISLWAVDDEQKQEYLDNISDYRFALWTVTISLESAEAYTLYFKDTLDCGGVIVGYGGDSLSSISFDEVTDDGMTILISEGTDGSKSVTFYVVSAYKVDDLTDGETQVSNTVYTELTDSLGYTVYDEATASWTYSDYVWNYGGTTTSSSKGSNTTYAGWLLEYEKDYNTYTFPFTTSASVNGYGWTHYNTSAAASQAEGKQIWDYIEGSYYSVTLEDSHMYFYAGTQDDDNKIELSEDDYYFTSVKVSRSEYDWDVWEDEQVSTAAHPNGDLDESIYIYVKCVHPELVDTLTDAGDGWYLIDVVDFTGSSATYTFTDAELACEPYCVKVSYNTTNYYSTCSVSVEVKVRDGSDNAVYKALHDAAGNWLGYEYAYLQDTSDVSVTSYASADDEGTSRHKKESSATKTLTILDETYGGYKTVSTTNDVVNGVVYAVYDVAAYDGYVIPRSSYLSGTSLTNHLQQNGVVFPINTEVVFYDLLPIGVEFDASVEPTVGRMTNFSQAGKPSGWDDSQVTLTDWTVKSNWEGTGRTMVAFYISYSGADPTCYYYNEDWHRDYGVWGEGYAVQFHAYYEWSDIEVVENSSNPNIVAYMQGEDATADGFLGTPYLDDGGSSVPSSTYSDFSGKDINGDGAANAVIYAAAAVGDDNVMASQGDITKLVRADANATDKYLQRTSVAANGSYTYQIRVQATSGLKDIVIFDKIEDGVLDHTQDEDSYIADSSWFGTFLGLDVTALKLAGVDPVVYYCTSWDCVMPSNDDGTWSDMDEVLASSCWIKADEYTGDLSDVKAFAVDCRKATDGTDFTLGSMESVTFMVHMQAPELEDAGDAAYAYNNSYFYSVATRTGNTDLVQSSTTRLGIGEPDTFILEKETEGDIPDGLVGEEYEFHLTILSDPEDEDGGREDFANRIYHIYKKDGDDWVETGGTHSTDSEGYLYLYPGQRAVFDELSSSELDSLVAEETESIFWQTTVDVTSVKNNSTTRTVTCLVTNTYRTPAYITKVVTAVPDDADISEDLFTFQVLAKDENGDYVPYANEEYWLVSSAKTNGISPDRLNDETLYTDGNGCLTLHAGETAAVFFYSVGAAFKVVETDTGENFITTNSEYTGTTFENGVSVIATNIYRWKDLELSKTVTHQDNADCDMEFTFRVLHVTEDEKLGEVEEPVVGNAWKMVDADGEVVTDEDGNEIAGFLDDNGEFTAACAGYTVIISGLAAGENYRVVETGDLGIYYEDVTGAVDVSMPIYSTGSTATYTNDYLMRDLSVTKLVASDDADCGDAEFTFTLYLEKSSDGGDTPDSVEYETQAYVPYVIKENGQTGDTLYTSEDGTFTLKSGQTAIFSSIGLTGTWYKVAETGNDTDYSQIYPADNEPVTGIFSGEGNTATFINGSEGYMTLSKNYNYHDGDEAAANYVNGLQVAANETDREVASVTFTMKVDGEDWPQVDVDVTVIDALGNVPDDTVTWEAGCGITVMPWQTIILSPEIMATGAGAEYTEGDDVTDYTYEISETETVWLIDEGDDVWLQVSQTDPENRGAATGDVLTGPAVTITNTVTSFELAGSTVYKRMSLGSTEVPTGRKLLLVLEQYVNGQWVPAEGVAYLTFDEEGPTCDEIQYTGSGGVITLKKTENGYPRVSFLDAVVYLNLYEGMNEGDLRLIEDQGDSDSTWGYLAGYDDESVGYGYSLGTAAKASVTTVDEITGEETTEVTDEPYAVTLVDSNESAYFKVAKVVEGESGQSFTFYLTQVLGTYTDGEGETVSYTEAGANIYYTVYDRETDELVGYGTTDSQGRFYLTGGQYALFEVANGSVWNVKEAATAGWNLEQVKQTEDDVETVADNAAEVYPAAEFSSLLMASSHYQDSYVSDGDAISQDDFEVWYYDSTGAKRLLTSSEFDLSTYTVSEDDVDEDNNLPVTISYYDETAGEYISCTVLLPMKIAVAIYSATDYSLVMMTVDSTADVPTAGSTYTDKEGKSRTATAVWTKFDKAATISSYSAVKWSGYRFSFKSVKVEDTIYPKCTAYWFYGFTSSSFTSIDLSNLDTRYVTDMTEMFYNCYYLTSLKGLSGLDTSGVTTMYYMFYNCYRLTSLAGLEDWDTSSVTDMRHMFESCYGLTSISALSEWDTGNVTSLYLTFYNCRSLTSLTGLEDWDVHSVTTLYETFYNCYSLTTLSALANWDVGSVTTLELTFYNCYGLTTLSALANWDVSSVTTLYLTFYNCHSLASLTGLENWDVHSVTTLYETFESCYGLTTLSALANWDVSGVTTLVETFYACYGLPSLTGLDNWDVHSVTTLYRTFYNCHSLTTLLALANWDVHSVTTLYQTFYNCYTLEGLTGLDNWDVSAVTTLEGTFYNCYGLTSLTAIKNWDVSGVTTMAHTFRYCTKLTNLEGLNNWDMSGVTTTTYMFYQCLKLTDLTALKNWDVSGITVLSYMFDDCEALEKFEGLDNWDVSGTRNMTYMFANCYVLTDISALKNWDMSGSKNTKYMFYNDKLLSSLSGMENWDMSGMTDLSYMFYNCTALADISALMNWDVSSVTTVAYMFRGCTSLTELTGLNNWNTESITDFGYMFSGCSKLTDLSAIHNWNVGGVRNMSCMFQSCTTLADLSGIRDWNMNGTKTLDHMFASCTALTDPADLVNWDMSGTNTVTYMFYNCTSLTDLSGLKNWDMSGITSLVGMFDGCTSLNDLSGIQNWDVSAVTNMNYLFYNCSSLNDLSGIRNWDVSAVTTVNYIFCNCKSMTDLSGLDNWDVSALEKMEYAFENCTALTDLSALKNWDTSSVTDMYGMFYGCTSLTKLDGLDNWDTGKLTTMYSMFYGCTALTDLTALANWNVAKLTTLQDTFYNCTSLETLDGLDNWDTGEVTTMYEMFYGCTALVDASALSGWNLAKLTDLSYAFYNCTSLETLDVSNWGVTKISNMDHAFYNCGKLETLDMGGWTTSSLSDVYYAFYGCTNLSGSITIMRSITSSSYYTYAFRNCSTAEGTSFVINWTSGYSSMATTLYNTRTSGSNVVLGEEIS